MKKSLRKLSALNVKKVFLAFIAVALMLNAQAQLQSALPLDAYGVWDRKAYLPFTDSSHVKTFKGIKLFAKWSGIQAIDSTTYDWSIFDQTLAFADRHGLYTYVGIGVGPECPQWIYDNGVPKMFTNTTELGGIFPYYPDADYKRHYFKLIEALSDYIDGLDQNLKESILFVQARTGCTGDEVPVKGDYLPGSTYQMSDQEWEDFRLESFGKFKQFISDPLNMPLHFNGINYNDPKYVEEWNWVIDNIGTGFGIKGSAYVRGHHLTFENDNKNTWYDMLVNPQELALFSRAEMDQSHTRPLYLINKPLGFYWGVLSGLNTGLSIWDHTQSAIAAIDEYPEIKQSLEFFNRYAPEMYPAT
ncbi:MAG: hypothetical protein KAS71_11205, partial [Bacteroidales bacterium]|nr:hypothetical protein [Bacteroidales bacterium]